MVDIWDKLRRVISGVHEFENFLLILTAGLFSLLLVRVIMALIMGRWNLF